MFCCCCFCCFYGNSAVYVHRFIYVVIIIATLCITNSLHELCMAQYFPYTFNYFDGHLCVYFLVKVHFVLPYILHYCLCPIINHTHIHRHRVYTCSNSDGLCFSMALHINGYKGGAKTKCIVWCESFNTLCSPVYKLRGAAGFFSWPTL